MPNNINPRAARVQTIPPGRANAGQGTTAEADIGPPQEPGVFSLTTTSINVTEGSNATIPVSRTNGSDGGVAVDYAVGGVQTTPQSGTLSWAGGDATPKSASVLAGLVEATTQGSVTLSNPRRTDGGVPAPTLGVSSGTITVNEVAEPVPGGPTPTTMQSSVTQRDVTVNFDKEYPVGQFANGDYFVVGTPIIVSHSPAWDGTGNGAMKNPSVTNGATGTHGFASTHAGYSAAANIATNYPHQTSAGDQIVVSRGYKAADASAGQKRGGIGNIIVFAVVNEPPPAGSFRPSLSGVRHGYKNISDIRWDKLPNWPVPASAPNLSGLTSGVVDRVWSQWMGQNTGREGWSGNVNYGRDLGGESLQVIFSLMLDYPQHQKEALMYKAIQQGIDIAGRNLFAAGNNFTWSAFGTGSWGKWGGALGQGRKVFAWWAALMLEAPELVEAAQLGPRWYQEDGQVYWVNDAASNACVGYYRGGCDLTSADQIPSANCFISMEGVADWGERAILAVEGDNVCEGRIYTNNFGSPRNSYRWMGSMIVSHLVLAAKAVPNGETLYNHPPAFEYTQWYMDPEQNDTINFHGRVEANGAHFTQFQKDIWNAHAPSLIYEGS